MRWNEENWPFHESDVGEFTCPVCWLKFDRGDVMHVAVHDSLFGDLLLEEQMLRFQPLD